MNEDDILAIVNRPRADGHVQVELRPDPRFGRFLPDGTPRLSPSQVNQLLTCPARWKRHYLDGIPDPAGVDAMLGSILHAAMEVALTALQGGELVGSREIQEATARAIAAQLSDPTVLASFRDPPGNIMELEQEARFAIRTAWNWVLETGFQPTHIEHGMTTKVPTKEGPVGLVMIADAIGTFPDGKWAIIDWKFPKRNPKQYGAKVYARSSYVLAANLYDLAASEEGIKVDALIIAHFGRGENRPAIATEPATEQARQRAKTIAQGAIQLVLSQTLPENPVAAGALCSAKYCAYWGICPGGGMEAPLVPTKPTL